MISQSLQNQAGRNASPAAPAAGAAPASPDVMTPAEAAAVLRVSEEDVMAAITAGDLKARKIGNAYRISKDALDTFLKGS
jgi:excisionase family DNA binding protein